MRIVVLFGGKSVEHEISIISAFQVIEVLKTKYEVLPVYISKKNEFYYDKKMDSLDYFRNCKKRINNSHRVAFSRDKDKYYFKGKVRHYFDFIFPIVHGKGVEDGSLLNLFKFKGLPIVGNNSIFYNIAQDKYMTKKLLDSLGIDNISGKLIRRGEDYKCEDFSFPCIVKPNNLGSSLGISIVKNKIELARCINDCFQIDNEVLVEKYLEKSREYNISVLNNDGKIEVSNIEEVVKEGMFSFADKYLSGNKEKGMAKSTIKKKQVVDKTLRKEIESIAKKIYYEFRASGVIRIDFLYEDKLYVNEINSIPGSYAYYLWEDKYDFLELLEIALKEGRRNFYLESKKNELIEKDLIFKSR